MNAINIHRLFTVIAIFSGLLIAYIFADAHRSRAALIPTKKISDKALFEEQASKEGLNYHFEDKEIIEKHKNLIPSTLQENPEEQFINFLQ